MAVAELAKAWKQVVPSLLTVREIRDLLGCSRSSIYRWIDRGWLARVGRIHGPEEYNSQKVILIQVTNESLRTRIHEAVLEDQERGRDRLFLSQRLAVAALANLPDLASNAPSPSRSPQALLENFGVHLGQICEESTARSNMLADLENAARIAFSDPADLSTPAEITGVLQSLREVSVHEAELCDMSNAAIDPETATEDSQTGDDDVVVEPDYIDLVDDEEIDASILTTEEDEADAALLASVPFDATEDTELLRERRFHDLEIEFTLDTIDEETGDDAEVDEDASAREVAFELDDDLELAETEPDVLDLDEDDVPFDPECALDAPEQEKDPIDHPTFAEDGFTPLAEPTSSSEDSFLAQWAEAEHADPESIAPGTGTTVDDECAVTLDDEGECAAENPAETGDEDLVTVATTDVEDDEASTADAPEAELALDQSTEVELDLVPEEDVLSLWDDADDRVDIADDGDWIVQLSETPDAETSADRPEDAEDPALDVLPETPPETPLYTSDALEIVVDEDPTLQDVIELEIEPETQVDGESDGPSETASSNGGDDVGEEPGGREPEASEGQDDAEDEPADEALEDAADEALEDAADETLEDAADEEVEDEGVEAAVDAAVDEPVEDGDEAGVDEAFDEVLAEATEDDGSRERDASADADVAADDEPEPADAPATESEAANEAIPHAVVAVGERLVEELKAISRPVERIANHGEVVAERLTGIEGNGSQTRDAMFDLGEQIARLVEHREAQDFAARRPIPPLFWVGLVILAMSWAFTLSMHDRLTTWMMAVLLGANVLACVALWSCWLAYSRRASPAVDTGVVDRGIDRVPDTTSGKTDAGAGPGVVGADDARELVDSKVSEDVPSPAA